jgi:hypothetical protein
MHNVYAYRACITIYVLIKNLSTCISHIHVHYIFMYVYTRAYTHMHGRCFHTKEHTSTHILSNIISKIIRHVRINTISAQASSRSGWNAALCKLSSTVSPHSLGIHTQNLPFFIYYVTNIRSAAFLTLRYCCRFWACMCLLCLYSPAVNVFMMAVFTEYLQIQKGYAWSHSCAFKGRV